MEAVRPIFVEAIRPDTCTKNYQFDIFIRQNLFPVTRYELMLKRTTDAAGNDYIETLKEPHFKLKSRFSDLVIYADGKYNKRQNDPMIEWCEPAEFKRYQELDCQIPVYVLIGEGPDPSEPEHVYLFPVRNVRYNRILRSRLANYEIPTYMEIYGKDLMSLRLDY